jgi:site-specific DNA-methyltransferase (adenine-specific)
MAVSAAVEQLQAEARSRRSRQLWLPITESIPPVWHHQTVQIECADAAKCYARWPRPTVIIADGPYGLSLFPQDPPTVQLLPDWYEPHIKAWSAFSLPETTLWFWGTELSWATVHPVLDHHDWEYRAAHIWDKGKGHIAGNVNSKTIRGFPVVTELCVQYTRRVRLPTIDGEYLPLQQWLRHEWLRSGLPLSRANEACGVANAATRKYFTQDHVWYFPPPEMMERLAAYATAHGLPTTVPYFSIDRRSPLVAADWARLRSKWHHTHGITNVWQAPAVRGSERLKKGTAAALHANQKPLVLMERIIIASSDPGDVVWEPFGGLCTGTLAALRTKRHCYAAEIHPAFYAAAIARLETGSSLLEGIKPGLEENGDA